MPRLTEEVHRPHSALLHLTHKKVTVISLQICLCYEEEVKKKKAPPGVECGRFSETPKITLNTIRKRNVMHPAVIVAIAMPKYVFAIASAFPMKPDRIPSTGSLCTDMHIWFRSLRDCG